MLTKLFKYDMKFLGKFMIPFLAITIITSCLSRIMLEMSSSYFVFKILYWTFVIIANTLIINSIFQIVIRIIMRFKSQLYGDESYLIHTLPVKRSDIVLSKIVSGSLWIFITLLVAFLCIYIEYMLGNMTNIMNGVKMFATTYQMNVGWMIVLFIMYILFIVEWFLCMLLFSIELGHRKSERKGLWSFFYACIFFVATVLINLIGVFGFSLFNPEMLTVFKTNEMPATVLQPFFITFVILYFIYMIVYFILSLRGINKHLNVD